MSDSIDMTLGKLLATCSQIDQKVERLVFRLDDAEQRIEKLEQFTARNGLWVTFVEKAIWGVLGAAGILALKSAGML